MIETILLDYLDANASVPCYMERPERPPESYVLIEKTGSSRSNHINRATIALQSYAPTLYQAAALNEEVKTLMDESIELGSVCRAQLNSDYNFTDTASKGYRYQAVYDITHY